MIELVDEFALVDDVGQAHLGRAVDELESDPAIAVQLPDHLQHQQLVKVRIEQGAHDRIDAEGVIVDTCGDIRDHGASLGWRAASDKSARETRAFAPAGPENSKGCVRG